MKKTLLMLSAVLPLMFAACQQEEIDPLADYDDSVKATISVNRDSYEADCDSCRFIVRIKSTYLWKIEIPDEATWLTSSAEWGDSVVTKKVYFHLDANTTEKDRSAVITIRSGKAKKRILVSQRRQVRILDKESVDLSRIYIPLELRSNDFYKSSSTWYFGRSRQSEHFIVFWQCGENWDEYGEKTPADSPNAAFRVDINDLLRKAEQFYQINVEQLKFADVGQGKSTLDKYKMLIMLNYQTEWLATGAGYDNTIGALWVSPNTCQPVGSTIAHEIGHTFQYQVYCDYLLQGGTDNSHGPGWRYGFGANGAGGNAFWEQTAQWQSFQPYPGEIFSNYYFYGYIDSAHLHIFHEDPRYSNYFIHWYFTHRYGIEEVARLWKESRYPEDPAETYRRIHNLTVSQLNDDLFDYARRMVTWDVDALRDLGKNYIGRHKWDFTRDGDYYKVKPAKCPQSTGYNVISLSTPAAGETVTADFVGITSDGSFHIVNPDNAGWRYGFVAYCTDGTRTYSEIFSEKEATVSFTIPEKCSRLWFVVSGAPTVYERHAWDDNSANDPQWPFKVKFSGASVKN